MRICPGSMSRRDAARLRSKRRIFRPCASAMRVTCAGSSCRLISRAAARTRASNSPLPLEEPSPMLKHYTLFSLLHSGAMQGGHRPPYGGEVGRAHPTELAALVERLDLPAERADVVVGRADNAVVLVLFQDVGRPPGHAGDGE